MNEEAKAQQTYLDGYEAFEQGDFQRAEALANQCIALASQSSYWYVGALGLKCWVANFTGNWDALEQNAAILLASETGDNKPWFDGVALLNLGLANRRKDRVDKARAFLMAAGERYNAQRLHEGQPAEWQYVIDYFATLSRWAANERVSEWRKYLDKVPSVPGKRSELVRQLSAAAQLMLRYAEGEEVKKDAKELVVEGVSRTFLAVILLE